MIGLHREEIQLVTPWIIFSIKSAVLVSVIIEEVHVDGLAIDTVNAVGLTQKV